MRINNVQSRGFLFDSVKIKTPNRTAFDLSYENRLSCNMGYLVPTMCQECLPNDDYNITSGYFVRFAPLVAPIMQKVDTMVYTFFVPNRIIWSGWESFISPGAGNVTMANQPNFVPPVKPWFSMFSLARELDSCMSPKILNRTSFDSKKEAIHSIFRLLDYLGYTNAWDSEMFDEAEKLVGSDDTAFSQRWANATRLDALPILAYFKIYDEYVRDENLEEPFDASSAVDNNGQFHFTKVVQPLGGQPGLKTVFGLKTKCWEKDYFTSALTDPQRGATVKLPLGDDAPLVVKTRAGDINLSLSGNATIGAVTSKDTYKDAVFVPVENSGTYTLRAGSTDNNVTAYVGANSFSSKMTKNQQQQLVNNLKVDLSSATSITIETLRASMALQEFLEKSARTGSRYCENLLAEFGQSIEDSRLDRPEFVGGRRIPVQVSDVNQTSPTFSADGSSLTSVTGDYAGKAISSGSGYTEYHCSEHGWIIQLCCVLPRTSYFQGVPRKYTRFTYLDYAFPEFANLGEQEILNKELFFDFSDDDNSQDDETFGYTPRYAEYKYNYDEIHGEFTGSLNYWTMARRFDTRPNLNSTFVHCQPSTDIFAVTDNEASDKCYIDIWHDVKALRCLPMYGTPKF